MQDRDPYAHLLGQPVELVVRNGDRFRGILLEKTFSFIVLKENGGTCVLRRDVIDVIRTAVGDPPSAQALLAHGHTEVRKVPT